MIRRAPGKPPFPRQNTPLPGRTPAVAASDAIPDELPEFRCPTRPARHTAGNPRPQGSCECEGPVPRSEEHTSELQSRGHIVCRLLLEKKKRLEKRFNMCKQIAKK